MDPAVSGPEYSELSEKESRLIELLDARGGYSTLSIEIFVGELLCLSRGAPLGCSLFFSHDILSDDPEPLNIPFIACPLLP